MIMNSVCTLMYVFQDGVNDFDVGIYIYYITVISDIRYYNCYITVI